MDSLKAHMGQTPENNCSNLFGDRRLGRHRHGGGPDRIDGRPGRGRRLQGSRQVHDARWIGVHIRTARQRQLADRESLSARYQGESTTGGMQASFGLHAAGNGS